MHFIYCLRAGPLLHFAQGNGFDDVPFPVLLPPSPMYDAKGSFSQPIIHLKRR